MFKIFLSHNYKDKSFVEPIAIKLAEIYGTSDVFYDSWSIQPGENIVDKMKVGLDTVSYFFFFVSNNSLNSKMVELEWKTALSKSLNNKCKFIAIKADDCVIPQEIAQNKYLDLNNFGIDVVLNQMVQIINGIMVGGELVDSFSNILCEINKLNDYEIILTIKAIHFQEPISRYWFLLDNNLKDCRLECLSDGFYQSGDINRLFHKNSNKTVNALGINLLRPTTPSFPIKVIISTKNNGVKLTFVACAQEIKEGELKDIPISYNYYEEYVWGQ